jgi:hypothetical protein
MIMSTVTILYNLTKDQWEGKSDCLTSNYCQLQIGFSNNHPHVIFDDLSFGFELKVLDKIVQASRYPENEHIVYRSSAQPYLVSESLTLSPQTSYTLCMWAENAGKKSKFNYNFSTPAPTSTGDYENSSVVPPTTKGIHKYRFDNDTRTWVRK